jgi:hypothetical protein
VTGADGSGVADAPAAAPEFAFEFVLTFAAWLFAAFEPQEIVTCAITTAIIKANKNLPAGKCLIKMSPLTKNLDT